MKFFSRLKKDFREMREGPDHMRLQAKELESTVENFEELIWLSGKNNAGFTISGDHHDFTIHAKANDALYLLTFVAYFAFGIFLLNEFIASPLKWLSFLLLPLPFLLLFRYAHFSNKIRIDGRRRSISIQCNNIFGKHLKPIIQKRFSELDELSSKHRKSTSKAGTIHWNKIYMDFKDRKKFILSLPAGPYHFVNHYIFMDSLQRIIKNAV